MRRIRRKLYYSGNIIIGIIGVIMTLIGCLIVNNSLKAFLFGIGASMIASSIVAFLTSYYTISINETEDIITKWQLRNIFRTKQEMNAESNECLDDVKKKIDIIAIGMSGFLNYKGSVLERKLQEGVRIRIISCDNLEMLTQREIDENATSYQATNTMKSEVINLNNWVSNMKSKKFKIDIKFHSTYPGFSYLRIDNDIFFGPNLPLYKSQINMAFQFDLDGVGGQYLDNYFEQLWRNDKVCSKTLSFK